MNDSHEIRLAGSGGQGVILASVILAEAALLAGHYTTQSQAYGPEARGGSCKAETLISLNPIGFTKVQRPTIFIAFNQKAFDQYLSGVSDDCLVLVDSCIAIPERINPKNIVSLPIIHTAKTVIGKSQTANIIAIGAINELLNIAEPDVLKEAVKKHIPKGTEVLNMLALQAGIDMARAWKSGRH